MVWYLKVWGWLYRAGQWLRKWGAWLLGGLGAALAFVFYVLWRKREEPVGPPAKKDQQVEKREAERAAQEQQAAEKAAEQKIADARREAADDWVVAVDNAEKTADLARDNPEATDRFLDQVGDDMRRQ